MSNKKNRKNKRRNTHRHVFNIRKLHQEGENNQGNDKQRVRIEGSRIININKLQQYTDDLTAHSASCEGAITLVGERKDGLASILTVHCSSCQHPIKFETSKKVKGPRGYSRWECNLAAVWGQMATGSGHSQLQETMSTVGVPVMSKASFIHTERDIGLQWKEKLQAMAEDAKKNL